MENPAGESRDGALRLDFNRRLKLEFHGSRLASDAGLLAYRELDDALGLSAMACDVPADARTGKNGRHALVGMLRQPVFGEKNLTALSDLSGQWIDKVQARRSTGSNLLDMDSSVSPTHGEQESSVWNDHFECACYHPLFVFNQFGDRERCALRPGNVHSADDWRSVLQPVVER
jgi:hypothetical protein